MRVVAIVVCWTATGCDELFGLDPLDPPGRVACFDDRVQLQDGSGSHDPTLSVDRLRLYAVRAPQGNYDLYRAERTDTTQPFTTGSPIIEVDSPAEETDPALTEDELLLVFKSNRNTGSFRAWQATRSSRAETFSSPVLVPGMENTTVFGLDLSPDGLTLYFDDGANLLSVTRASLAGPFSSPVMLSLDRANFPSVSADGLELFYNAAGVLHRFRATRADMFDGATTVQIDSGAADADIVADNSALVLTGGAQSDVVYIRERCAR